MRNHPHPRRRTGAAVTATKVPIEPRPASGARRRGDSTFAGISRAAGIFILVILAGVAAFLVIEALPAVTAAEEDVPGGEGVAAYIAPLLFGTLMAAVIALLVATPLGVGIALFITNYAPRRVAQGLGYVIDLLAAIP